MDQADLYLICNHQKDITPALKTAEYPFSESDRGHFGNSFSALHHILGCKRESPRKDFLNGLFVSQTTIAAKTAGKNG